MKLRAQLFRYGVAGVGVNAAAFIAYLLFTGAGLAPPFAMTITYFSAMVVGFAVNRSITFVYNGNPSTALGKYIITYAAGYLLNLGGLVVLIRFFHFPHASAQGVLVFLVAVVMFTLLRFWVFPGSTRRVLPNKG